MTWFTDNMVANMYGPYFLILYAVVIVVTLIVCWLILRDQAESFDPYRPPIDKGGPAESSSPQWPIKLAGAVVIVGVGGYKLAVALAKGRRNVGFLIVMCIIALCILFVIRPAAKRLKE